MSANSPHADDETPEDVLGDVWDALDVLPAARSTPNLASSTIEMAAVSVSGGSQQPRHRAPAGNPDRRRWLAAGVIVAASLAAGFVTGSAGNGGRRQPRPPELAVVIQHLETLQEAGSVAFLEAFAKGDYAPPAFLGREGSRRGRPDGSEDGADTDDGQRDTDMRRFVPAPDLDAALAAFRRVFTDGESAPPPPVPEPPEVAGEATLEADESVQQFEFNRLTFSELPPSQREAYVALAEQLADPQRSDLVEAARLWHGWVAFADPVERAGLVELPMSERLEWLDRRMRQWRRFMPGRSGDGDRPDGPPGASGRGSSGRGAGGPPRPPRG